MLVERDLGVARLQHPDGTLAHFLRVDPEQARLPVDLVAKRRSKQVVLGRLERDSDYPRPPRARCPCQIMSADRHRSRDWLEDARAKTGERGFTGAVRPKNTADVPCLDAEARSGQHQARRHVAKGYVANIEQRGHETLFTPSRNRRTLAASAAWRSRNSPRLEAPRP